MILMLSLVGPTGYPDPDLDPDPQILASLTWLTGNVY
jgi:hypothetical protein